MKRIYAGLDLISLDNNHTKEYNYNNDKLRSLRSFHLYFPESLNYLPRGCTLVAKTPKKYIQKIKSIFVSFLISFSILSLCACSSKTQTNKLPDEKKFILPKSSDSKQELTISTEIKRDFEQSLKAFFKIKGEEEENIYDIGLKRGHFTQGNDE